MQDRENKSFWEEVAFAVSVEKFIMMFVNEMKRRVLIVFKNQEKRCNLGIGVLHLIFCTFKRFSVIVH